MPSSWRAASDVLDRRTSRRRGHDCSMRLRARAVLFDNDGVLVDSHEQVVACWTRVADEFGLDIEVLLDELVGVRAIDTLARHLAGEQLQAAASRLEDYEIQSAARTVPLRGALDLTRALTGGRWAIVTSGSRPLAEARWQGAGIPIPEITVTADDVTKGKPDPAPFLTGARLLDVGPQDCIAFEDSASGGESARAAGMTVIAVGHQPWPFEPSARIDDLAGVSVTNAGPIIDLDLTTV